MLNNKVTKEKAYADLGKYLCGEIIEKNKDLWVVYPSTNGRIDSSCEI